MSWDKARIIKEKGAEFCIKRKIEHMVIIVPKELKEGFLVTPRVFKYKKKGIIPNMIFKIAFEFERNHL